MLLHHAGIYSVVVVVVVGIVVNSLHFFILKTGDYIGDLYWLPIGY